MRGAPWLLVGLSLGLPAVGVAAVPNEPAAEISARDWSYVAIEALAARGLVHGYKDARFLAGRTLTRFEMASLVKRVLDSVIAIPALPSDVPTDLALPGPAATRGQGYEPPPTGRPQVAARLTRAASFTEADLATVKRLADTYSVELAVIGVNLQEAMDRLAALEGRIEQLEASLKDPEGPLQSVINSVARIDKIRFSGYVQARYQSFENTNEATSSGRDTQVVDSFTLRRVRLTVNARPTQTTGIKWQFEGAGSNLETRDAWIDYYFKGNPAAGYTASIGQMKSPFGFEVVQSSSVRESPERARIARFLFPDERDRGIKIASATGKRFFYELGVFNGMLIGARGINTNDTNNNKNLVGRIRTNQLQGKLDLGVSFDFGNTLRTVSHPDEGGISPANPRENTKSVLGVDFQWYPRNGTVVRGEWAGGKAAGSQVSGYILQLLQNVTDKDQLVVKYDWFATDDIAVVQRGPVGTPLGFGPYQGILSTLALGWVHRLDEDTRLKVFYEIHDRSQDRVNGEPFQWLGNVFRFEVITLF